MSWVVRLLSSSLIPPGHMHNANIIACIYNVRTRGFSLIVHLVLCSLILGVLVKQLATGVYVCVCVGRGAYSTLKVATHMISGYVPVFLDRLKNP